MDLKDEKIVSDKQKENKSPKKEPTKKNTIVGVITFVLIIIVLIIIGKCIFGSDEKEPLSASIKILTEATDLDKKQAEAVYNDFKSVGIDKLTSCKFNDECGDLKIYDFECKKCAGMLKIKDNKTFHIVSGNITLYSSLEGVENNINDYYVDDDKKFELLTVVESSVKECLKSPASAEFPDQVTASNDWNISRYKDTVTIKSHVDSQNSFGAMIRSNFTCQVSYDKKELIYLNIDGEDMFGTLVE